MMSAASMRRRDDNLRLYDILSAAGGTQEYVHLGTAIAVDFLVSLSSANCHRNGKKRILSIVIAI